MFESTVAELVDSCLIVPDARWRQKYHGVTYEVIVRRDVEQPRRWENPTGSTLARVRSTTQ
jgi:hypothetical protein